MTSPSNIRAYVDVKFEDKKSVLQSKKRRFISNKEKLADAWASNLRKTEKKTEFAPVTENFLLDGNRLVTLQEIKRQAVNICDHPSVNPLNVQIHFC